MIHRWQVRWLIAAAIFIGSLSLVSLQLFQHEAESQPADEGFIFFQPTTVQYALSDLQGERFSSESDQGQVVMLFFWASWCQPSRELLPWLVRYWREHQDQGLVFHGLALDTEVKAVSDYLNNEGLNFSCALISPALLAGSTEIDGLPVLYLIGRDGHVVQKYQGLFAQAGVKKQLDFLLSMGALGPARSDATRVQER